MADAPNHHAAFRPAFRSVSWVLLLVFVFVVPVLTIEFFHVEENGLESQDCPACQLQKSATAVGGAVAPELPAPVFRPLNHMPPRAAAEIVYTVAAASRSPPQSLRSC